jgi:erythromycin esterase-like protein
MYAQTMILKGLIDSGKIATLYTEASWMNCNRINAIFKEKGASGLEQASKYIRDYDLHYWKQNGFLAYLANKIRDGKLQLRGFDIEGIAPAIVGELMKKASQLPEVANYQRTNGEKFQLIKGYLGEESFAGWGPQSAFYEQPYLEVQEFILPVIEAYHRQANLDLASQWQSISDLFYWMFRRTTYLTGNKFVNQIETPKQNSLFDSARDSLMAALFLKQYAKGEKAVCLMSAFHAIRNSTGIQGIKKYRDQRVRSMAELLDSKLGERIYSICFVRASGKSGILLFSNDNPSQVKQPVKNSLERTLQKVKENYCFVDLQQMELKDSTFFMHGYYEKGLRSQWSRNFSGVFFIKVMEPLKLY